MNNLIINFLTALLLLTVACSLPVSAQRVRTDTRMIYHNGPVIRVAPNLYFIWYGNWPPFNGTTNTLVSHFGSYIGGSPYFRINTTYPNSNGDAPTGQVFYGGSVADAYSRGTNLTVDDIQQVVSGRIAVGALPLDTAGIYLVITSEDVTNTMPDGSSYCTPGTSPHHGVALHNGTPYKYGHVGSALRCPDSVAPQFFASNGIQLPTPNDNLEADAMASTMARLLNVIVTDPNGVDSPMGGWYDKFALENSDKCVGQFGTTYTLPNGARANVQLGGLHFLIQENWVNEKKGRCALSYP